MEDIIIQPRLFDDEGWPVNKFKPYWWNNPLDMNIYDHSLPIGSWYEEDVYYRPEYSYRIYTEPYEQFEDGTDVYNHMYDGGINYTLVIPSVFINHKANILPHNINNDVSEIDAIDDLESHRHLPPSREIIENDLIKIREMDAKMIKLCNLKNKAKELMSRMSDEGRPLTVEEIMEYANRPDNTDYSEGQIKGMYVTHDFYDENGNLVDSEDIPIEEFFRRQRKAVEQQQMPTTINVGGDGYNTNNNQQNMYNNRFAIPLPNNGGVIAPYKPKTPPVNGYRSQQPGYNPYEYMNQVPMPQPVGYYGVHPNMNAYRFNPYAAPQPNGYTYAPVFNNNYYRPPVDYNNPYPQYYGNNNGYRFNPYGSYARSPILSAQIQQQFMQQQINANKTRYRIACKALGMNYSEEEADRMFNPQSQMIQRTPEEVKADQNWQEVTMFMYYANNPGIVRSQEQIDAEFIQRKYSIYHQALDNHSLCEFFEEDLPRLMREFWIEDNIKPKGSRDHSRLYDSSAYNNLLRLHASSNPYLNKLMEDANRYDNNTSDTELGISDVLHTQANRNYVRQTPSDYLNLPEVQERRRKFTEALLAQVYEKSNLPKPDTLYTIQSPPTASRDAASQQIADNIDALIKAMPSATMIT